MGLLADGRSNVEKAEEIRTQRKGKSVGKDLGGLQKCCMLGNWNCTGRFNSADNAQFSFFHSCAI
jgi:hypothetical protein